MNGAGYVQAASGAAAENWPRRNPQGHVLAQQEQRFVHRATGGQNEPHPSLPPLLELNPRSGNQTQDRPWPGLSYMSI